MVKKLRKGFTLVELLIVIVIIGILAAAMLLSSSSATDQAEAAKFISDLRSFRSAYTLFRLNSGGDEMASFPWLENLKPYMDNPNSKWFDVGLGIIKPSPTNGNRWYWMFYMTDYSPGVRRALAGKAASLGFYGGETLLAPFPRPYYSGGDLLFYAAD